MADLRPRTRNGHASRRNDSQQDAGSGSHSTIFANLFGEQSPLSLTRRISAPAVPTRASTNAIITRSRSAAYQRSSYQTNADASSLSSVGSPPVSPTPNGRRQTRSRGAAPRIQATQIPALPSMLNVGIHQPVQRQAPPPAASVLYVSDSEDDSSSDTSGDLTDFGSDADETHHARRDDGVHLDDEGIILGEDSRLDFLSCLPGEIATYILLFADVASIGRARGVSKRWHELCSGQSYSVVTGQSLMFFYRWRRLARPFLSSASLAH